MGPASAIRWRRVVQAVAATRGQVLTYGGAPILAAYHSSSGGHTESAENYWSGSAPYLQGVADPYDDVSPHRDAVVSVSMGAFLSRFGVDLPVGGGNTGDRGHRAVPVGQGPVAAHRRHGSDRPAGAGSFGPALIPFSVQIEGDTVHFIADGYGHGIGMSQYGAEGMARQGYTYDEILRYYYTGVKLTQWYE